MIESTNLTKTHGLAAAPYVMLLGALSLLTDNGTLIESDITRLFYGANTALASLDLPPDVQHAAQATLWQTVQVMRTGDKLSKTT